MLRELRESDAEEVAALFQSVYGDERPIDAEEIVSWVNNAELKPEWLRVLELDGRVVGYGDIMIEDDEVALDAAASAGHWDTFFEWAEEQARADRCAASQALPSGRTSHRGPGEGPRIPALALFLHDEHRPRRRTARETAPLRTGSRFAPTVLKTKTNSAWR